VECVNQNRSATKYMPMASAQDPKVKKKKKKSTRNTRQSSGGGGGGGAGGGRGCGGRESEAGMGGKKKVVEAGAGGRRESIPPHCRSFLIQSPLCSARSESLVPTFHRENPNQFALQRKKSY